MAFGARVYTGSVSGASFSTAGSIIELQVPIDVGIELIRAWIQLGFNGIPLKEGVQPICIYGNDAPATAGNGLVEGKVQGGGHVAPEVTGLTQATIGASPVDFYCDGFLLRDGWEYYPVPEERIWLRGNTTTSPDNIGLRFPVAPESLTFFSFGMTWAELS